MDLLKNAKIFFTEKEIKEKVKFLGQVISNDYHNTNLTLMSVMKGSIIFVADLIRSITMPCKLDIILASSYSGTKTTGKVDIKFDGKNKDFKDENILIVDDILDTGITLKKIVEYFDQKFNPKSIKTCVFLDKPSRRIENINADYVGFEIPNKFVIGYGLDYNENYRNIQNIYALQE